MGVASWVVLGALVGSGIGRGSPVRLPGGRWSDAAAGAAGGFVGGGIVALATGGDASAIDVLALAVSVLGAALLTLGIRRAAQAQPRTRA